MVKAAYGAKAACTELVPGFDAIARALNRGDLAHAMTVAVLTRLPELDWEGAARLAGAKQRLRKYNPDEPRDWHGRWTDDDGADASGQDLLPENPVAVGPEDGGNTPNPQPEPDASDTSQADAGDDSEADPPDERPPLERKYDDLGPVEFAKQVIQFGDRLA